ncbi:MAG: OmpA family protein [Bryobacteraceae bacterium]
MKRIVALSALGVMASALFAQGLNAPANQSKEDWEEINFEFNSSILSDGYPSLLRLADLLSQHRDYKVVVTGNTDYVGSGAYNETLSLARANTVKSFLVKYGAAADQVSVAGEGKRQPEVDNQTKEGRFINRRVSLQVTDGKGKVVKQAGIGEVLQTIQGWQDQMAKKQQECCDAILKRLDKLDDILAAVKALQGENAALKGELADQRNQISTLRDKLENPTKPATEAPPATPPAAPTQEAKKGSDKFSLLGISVGPTYGSSNRGNATFDANGRFFSPFGSDGSHAVQAQGEYIYNNQDQEGQFDLGLVNRWGNVQAGVFGSFKYLNYKQYQTGGALGQGAFLLDYIFGRGRIGVFGTQGFKNYAVVNSVTLAPGAYMQTYAKVVNQYGADALFGVWGNAYLQGNLGLLRREVNGGNTVGGEIKLTQPVSSHLALTAALDYNQTGVFSTGNGQVLFGLEMGSYIHPKDYGTVRTPVPMDVPRIRYEFGTRRVGTSPPIANAGPSQIGVQAGIITLNGSASYDPLGETLTYAWSQLSGPTVTINNATQSIATFNAAAGQSYQFLLKVTNTDGISAQASTMVTTAAPVQTQIVQFTAQPAAIVSGQSSTLNWVIQNGTSATITPGVGSVNANTGSVAVSPTTTTTYTLTANGVNGSTTQSVQITVGATTAQILRFAASPTNIATGGQSTLSWTTSGASTVSIAPGIGTVAANGSTTVSPATTTTYTITATGTDGKAVTSAVQITVGAITAQIVRFAASPNTIAPGGQSTLSWSTTNATTVSISPGVGTVAANGSATVSPVTTTTYTISATGADGKTVTAPVIVTVSVTAAQIVRFVANPSSIAAGAQTTLSWSTTGASTVSIAPGIGTVSANGSATVSPAATTTYTISATGTDGKTVTATAQVTVGAITAQILRFAASPSTIAAGGQSTLSWTTSNATSVSISPGVGSVSANGSTTVSPAATTIYTISATGADGNTVTAPVTVTVGVTTAQIVRFSASPLTIAPGGQSTLSWSISGASTVSISPGIGAVSANGSVTVSPAATTTYTISATGTDGKTVTAPVTVTVSSTTAQIVRFAASPNSIATGGQSTLSWSTSGATTVSISPGIGTVAANGSITVSPATTTTYTISATGGDGNTVTAAVQVTVGAVTAQIVRFSVSPSSIAIGGQATLSWTTTNATTVSISQGIGSVAANGSTTVSPAATTVYTISATGTDGNTVTATVQVTVGAVTAQILRFTASPSTIAEGAQSTLSWTTSNATTVSISPGIGAVAANGSTTVSPAVTTTYTISVTGADGKTVTSPVTVTVSGSAIPQIVTFVATPQTVSPGQSTQICWQVTGATNISITPGVGNNLNANACATVTPSATTTYTLTATNAVGQVQGNLTVNVGTVQILSFQANPVSSTAAGAPVVLSWTTTNATSVVLTAADIGPMTLPVNGSYTDNPITNETYTLTAYGPGGQTVSVTISVFVR